MARELRLRGFSADVYAGRSVIEDDHILHDIAIWRQQQPTSKKLPLMAALQARLLLRRYDLLVVLAGHRNIGIRSRHLVHYFQGVEIFNHYHGYILDKPCFVTTPNLLSHAPEGSVILPRPVNTSLFKRIIRSPNTTNEIVVGHFWRRGSTASDYAFRWFKGTDFLDEAISVLLEKGYKVKFVDNLTARSRMPEVLAGLDVLAEQFRMGIYGLPALEALVVGTPVVGYYKKELAECPQVYDSLIRVERAPPAIAEGILEARKKGTVTIPAEIEKFHSAKNAVDVFLRRAGDWGLL